MEAVRPDYLLKDFQVIVAMMEFYHQLLLVFCKFNYVLY